MAMTPESNARGTSRATRARIALQVATTVLLALVAAVLLDWLSERPGLRMRFDLTSDESNTLSPASLEVLERLPVDAKLDVFFQGRDLEGPFLPLGRQVQEHTRKVLRLLQEASHGRLETEEHDLSDRRGDTRALARLRELEVTDVEPGGLVVVSAGRRKQVLKLLGELSDVDPGTRGAPGQEPQPPRVLAYRAEEAVVSALHKVATENEPKVLFTRGHGELDPSSTDPGGVASLRVELEGDGFQVATYDVEKQGAIPPECQVLVILAPEEPFTEREVDEIKGFVDSGGRLIAAPDFKKETDGQRSLVEVLQAFGIQVNMHGLLARPLATGTGGVLTGDPQCGNNVIVWSDGMAAQNAVTEPLRRANRRVYLPFSRKIQRGPAPPGGAVIQILTTEPDDWFDLADASRGGTYDWTPSPSEERGPFAGALQAVFPARRPVPKERAIPGGRPECRVLCVASAAAFTNTLLARNRDFLLNAFNWVSTREYRVSVRASSPQARRVEIGQGKALATIHLVAVVLVPGLCLLLGLFTAWKRRH